MSKIYPNIIFVLIGAGLTLFLSQCKLESHSDNNSFTGTHINGVSFVAPRNSYQGNPFDHVKNVNANWVAIMPYAFCDPENPEIVYDLDKQWWGERTHGTVQQIADAKSLGIKVLLKPHVWVRGQGWNGDFECNTEVTWQQWEQSYESYILNHARVADSMGVKMFCVGLEFKKVVNEREAFWRQLIDKVRKIYDGPVLYAANWDNYQNVPFWDKVDYIGVNAYFPLSQKNTPESSELVDAYSADFRELKSFAYNYGKQVIFTEFGYRSVDNAAGNQWELPGNHGDFNGDANFVVQRNAYKATFQTFWGENWFAGGFLWKWYANHERGGGNNTDYTPQNKPVAKVIEEWYDSNYTD